MSRITLGPFLAAECAALPDAGGLAELLLDLAGACQHIARTVAGGPLCDGLQPNRTAPGALTRDFERLAADAFRAVAETNPSVAGGAAAHLWAPDGGWRQGGDYLLVYDPLDGSSNIDVNLSVGSIFSILRMPATGCEPTEERAFLQPGTTQVAAGYAIYGPSTMLVLTVGNGVHAFTLERSIGEFLLTHRDLRVPERTGEFAINTSNSRFWETPVRRYVAECMAGAAGPRGRDFNMRWIASLVAEAHRILMRGGVFLYPRDRKDPEKPGRLRLLYEANPVGMLIEQAGGRASTGRGPVLELAPAALHQRVPFVFGSREEVERIERYHAEDNGDNDLDIPLFHARGLFRDAIGV